VGDACGEREVFAEHIGLSCHCEERSDAAISIVVPNWPEIASLRLQ
jgi:hypothetical protein